MLPTLTVVIPSYKADKTILRTVKSALSQVGCAVEIILIEDGVFDKTKNVVSDFLHTIRYVQLEKNIGATKARNLGLTLSTCEFIIFLDSDDEISENLLAGAYMALLENDADICFCPFKDACDGKYSQVYQLIEKNPIKISLAWNLEGIFTPPCAVVWRKSFLVQIGGWFELMKHNDDGELILRAMLNNAKVCSSQDGYGIYWHHQSINRISFANSNIVLESADVAFKKLLPLFERCWPKQQIGQWCFMYVREAARYYRKTQTMLWLERSKNFGYGGELMSIAYRLSRFFLGYYHVEKLFNFFRKIRKVIFSFRQTLPRRSPKLLRDNVS